MMAGATMQKTPVPAEGGFVAAIGCKLVNCDDRLNKVKEGS